MTDVLERLKTIESDTRKRMLAEQENPSLPIPIKTVAGFQVPDEAARQRNIERRLEQFQNYDVAETRLRNVLEKVDVAPLAVLPAKAWAAICEKSGLYVLKPRADGTVPVDFGAAVLMVKRMREKILNLVFGTILVLSGVIGSVGGAVLATPAQPEGYAIAMVVGAFGVTVCSAIINWGFFGGTWESFIHARVAQSYSQGRNRETMLKTLFSGETNRYLLVSLPTPPAEVAAILMKIADLDPKVAAVGSAIHLPELREKLDSEYMKELTIRQQLREDPIVFVEMDGAVAIVAQFGDFPVEKEIVAKLKAEEILA